jgi:hypothetical protein
MKKDTVIQVLIQHTHWEFTDFDHDQIRCSCGWLSQGFIPKTREKAIKVFVSHQAEEIIKKENS